MSFNITHFLENTRGYIADTAINLAINGVPKKPAFVSMVAITHLAAIYLIQPEDLYSQLTTAGIAFGGAWILTEGGYHAAGKIKNMMTRYFFIQAMRNHLPLSQEEKNQIANMIDSLPNL